MISRSAEHAKLLGLYLQSPLAFSTPAARCVKRLFHPPLDRYLL
jgi:hypothetical protein